MVRTLSRLPPLYRNRTWRGMSISTPSGLPPGTRAGGGAGRAAGAGDEKQAGGGDDRQPDPPPSPHGPQCRAPQWGIFSGPWLRYEVTKDSRAPVSGWVHRRRRCQAVAATGLAMEARGTSRTSRSYLAARVCRSLSVAGAASGVYPIVT